MAELKYGWVGKILRVDLTTGKLTEVPTSNYAPKFVGGRSMAAKIYWDEVSPEVKAYDPENKLIIMQGPANGTLAPGATHTAIATKSPVPTPETYCYSCPSGHWGPELKFAGYDGVIVQGKAPEPVYLWIHDGEAEIRKAGYLWGKVTSKVDEELKRLHGLQTRTMVIGPAGENLVKPSVIELEGTAAAGIGGFGAVMGSKNLKAIAVRGTGSVKVARPKELMDLREYWIREYAEPGAWGSKGPWRRFDVFYKARTPEGRTTWLEDEVTKGNVTVKPAGCWGCYTCCQCAVRFKDLNVQNGSQQCNDMSTLQQDDYFRTGKYITPDDWEFGRLCDDLGISNTQVIGHTATWFRPEHHGGTWAWELVHFGLWTPENTGLPVGTKENPNIGSKEFNRGLLQKVAYREGIGNLLAEGQQRYLRYVYETAPSDLKQVAKDIYERNIWADNYHEFWQPIHIRDGITTFLHNAVHSRGCFPGHVFGWGTFAIGLTAQGAKALAKELFGDERAADGFVPEFKAAACIYGQHLYVELDSMTSCYWGGMPALTSRDTLGVGAKVFSAVTGIDMTLDDVLKKVGERTYNLERAIQVREGRRRKHDMMNDYHFTRARWPEPSGRVVSEWMNKDLFKKLMDEYYALRGWDLENGIPTRKRLEELDLKDIADDLEKKYKVPIQA